MGKIKPKIDRIINPKETALIDDFVVRRLFPRRDLRRIGGFVFFDHFGELFAGPKQLDVPPHPHVGLQTVTYLFSGELLHRDSLGTVQTIKPGEVNWMTAGKGIVHSEQATKNGMYHGIQTWVGLPKKFRNIEPVFEHFDKHELPVLENQNSTVRVIAGEINGLRSPVRMHQELVYVDIEMGNESRVDLNVSVEHEIGVFLADGSASINGEPIGRHQLAYMGTGSEVLSVESETGARLVALGGEPLTDPTVIYWNFVTDSIDEAKANMINWEEGKFPKVKEYRKFSE